MESSRIEDSRRWLRCRRGEHISDEGFEFVAGGAEALAHADVERIHKPVAAESESRPARDAVGGVNDVGERFRR